MRAKMLLLVPLGLTLGGCATMDLGGLLGFPTTTTYPTYTYPSYSYGQPTYTYPSYSYGSPAVVAPSGTFYGGSSWDHDGDRVANHLDRYPYDPRRW